MKILKHLVVCLHLAAFGLTGSNCVFADAKSEYESKCSACHGFGIAGAPRLDDKADWQDRIASGMDTLYSNAINGFTGNTGIMPPKGGFTGLSDDQVKVIVDYMVGGQQ